MESNTDRSGRFVFDRVAREYDVSRPTFGSFALAQACLVCGLSGGARVLEIGAGSGQLTESALNAGLFVTALEPGEELLALLEARFANRENLTVSSSSFESFESDRFDFDAILAANSFHWIDPSVAFVKARRLLKDGGSLVLFWNFPILASSIQSELNSNIFVGDLSAFQHPSQDFDGVIEAKLRAGRSQIRASGSFDVVYWSVEVRKRFLDYKGYVALRQSYADVARLEDDARERFADALEARMVQCRLFNFELLDYIYCCVATKVA